MTELHCHMCGGIIRATAKISYRPPRASAQFALPHMGPCKCTPPIVYEDPPIIGSSEDASTDSSEDNSRDD